jgi:hypothetical protein
MAIRETIVVDVAEVQPTDDYRVEVRQRKRRTQYTTDQVRDLANELIEAAEKVDASIAEDIDDRGERMRAALVICDGELAL